MPDQQAVIRMEVTLFMEMQCELTTLGLLNSCIKITSCTILLLCAPRYVSHVSLSLDAQEQDEGGWMVGGFSRCSRSDAECLAGFLGAIRAKVMFTLWEDAGKSHEREKHVPVVSRSSTDFIAANITFLKIRK